MTWINKTEIKCNKCGYISHYNESRYNCNICEIDLCDSCTTFYHSEDYGKDTPICLTCNDKRFQAKCEFYDTNY